MVDYIEYDANAAREFIALIKKRIDRLTPAKTKEFLKELNEIDEIHIKEAAKDILFFSKLERIDPAVSFIIEQKYLLNDKTLRPTSEDIQTEYNTNLDDEASALNFEDIPALERAGLEQIVDPLKNKKGLGHISYVFDNLRELTPKSVANFIIEQTIARIVRKPNRKLKIVEKHPVGLPKKYKEACKKLSGQSGQKITKNITINIGKEKNQLKPTDEAKLIYSLNANDKFHSIYLPFFFGMYGVKEITENSVKQYDKLKKKGECSKDNPFLMLVGAKKISDQRYSTSQRLKAIRLEALTDKVQTEDTKKESATEKKEKASVFLFEFADTGEGFTRDQLQNLYNRIYQAMIVDATDETKSFKKTLTKGSAKEKHGEIGLAGSAKIFAQTFGGTFEINSNYHSIDGVLYKDSIICNSDKYEFKPHQKAVQRDYDIQNVMQKRAKTYINIQLTEHSLRDLDKIILEKQKYAAAERPLVYDENDMTETSVLETVDFDEFVFPEEM